VLKKKATVWTLGLGFMSLILAASAACGEGTEGTDSDNDTVLHAGGQPDVVIDVLMKDLRFMPNTMEVKAGQTVQVNVTNMDGMEHDMVVDGLRIEMVGKAAGGHHAGAAADLLMVHTMAKENGSIMFRTDQRGTYEFYCTLPGHRAAGMVGEMKVV